MDTQLGYQCKSSQSFANYSQIDSEQNLFNSYTNCRVYYLLSYQATIPEFAHLGLSYRTANSPCKYNLKSAKNIIQDTLCVYPIHFKFKYSRTKKSHRTIMRLFRTVQFSYDLLFSKPTKIFKNVYEARHRSEKLLEKVK